MDLLPALLRGLGVTAVLTVGGSALALALSFLAGLGRRSPDPVARWTATAYVHVFRGTSALVQLYWVYFALPLLLGVDLPPLAAGILVLGLNVGAYGAEVVRGALAAVPRGQAEAALALDLDEGQRLRRVILPQALPAMLPPFGNLFVELLKGSALVSLVAVADLTAAARFLRDDAPGRTAEILLLVLVLYFVVARAGAAAIASVEKRAARWRPPGAAR